ncbi:tetratricopeptide repeat protein 28 [Chrysoperla carnea]|uniref:tetratricopeptide repeat protein 28 n=1 Tax=Chrysoperla carnea TaxID=189513 RepID=UPI001D069F37|nr:tetratricopeptide repeat protein 28 [Chrysoperla carnea]
MSQRDFSEVEPEGTTELPAASRALFLDKVQQSNAACQAGDFATAVSLYTDALQLDPTNHILYSNRSAARLKQGQFSLALQDATRARELCPTWPKAYFRQGVALQCLGRHGEALAAFSAGLAQEPQNTQLLSALVEASVKSPLRHTLQPIFQQLHTMKLDQSPFVIISVVGQELLSVGLYNAAVTVLESALRIGSCSLKLRGSVFSALSSAHWALNQLDKAIGYMQQDLAVAKSLGDTAGECRAHGNLGSAYFSQGSYKEALTAHRYQLVLAMKCKDTQAAAAALTSLGHVYTAIGDYPNALASHKQCVQLVKQIGDRLQEAREIGNVGAVYLTMGEFDSAVDCHTQHLRLARRLGNQVEEARAYSNLGSSHHYRRNFAQAMAYHEKVLRIAQDLGDRAIEARAYAGLGHAARCAGDYVEAKRWHERQLDMALVSRDRVAEGRACSNLGIVYQLLGEHDAALKLHQAHLNIARALHDRAGMGRAYGNIGNAYSAAGLYESAIKYHKQELTISKEVHDRSSEASTHGNLAVAYQALGAHDMALLHYRAHLGIARELKDAAGEACALLNLGNCLSSRGEFAQAVPFYEQYLMLSQELTDVEGEAKACHFLGYAHYCLGNYREAVRYYDQDLALAKDLQDKMNMGRAYCNLGLAHLALGKLDTALECQKYFLAIAHMTQHAAGKFRALGNIGDVLIKMGDIDEALKMYHRQLGLARAARDRGMEASACGALGLAHRLLRRLDKSLGYHTQELNLRQEINDQVGQCKAHGHIGSTHMALGNYTQAVKCYQAQLECAQELRDSGVEAQAFGNLGIARLNMGRYEEAIGHLEQQLATLERISTQTAQLDKACALGSLGDCYDALGDHEEAAKCHEQHLALSLELQNIREQERAYRGLGRSRIALGDLQQALVCLEKRLVVSHELGSAEAKAAAYGELGHVHSRLGNLEQAVSCFEHQRSIARELGDRCAEATSAAALGSVYQQMGELTTALSFHQADLALAEQLGQPELQVRATGNLGQVHEALGNHSEAIRYQEQHLSAASAIQDQLAQTQAYSALGRIHHTLGNTTQAVTYLSQGLSIAESLGRNDEEAKIRHRLGLALWADKNLEGAQQQLDSAAHLLESLRCETRQASDFKMSLFELQNSTYQALQRILVALNRPDEALVVAERSRTRAFVDLLLERQGRTEIDTGPKSLQQLLEFVNRQKASVLYYSVAGCYLYAWLIIPSRGVVKFHESSLAEEGDDTQGSLLERLVQSVRDSLGVSDEIWPASQTDDVTADKAGFLRMVNRNHLFNSSNYSLSSLFSLGSVGGSVASLQGSTRSSASLQGSTKSRKQMQQGWQGPSCLQALYQLLIAPFEECLPTTCNANALPHRKNCSGRRELVLVLEGDLFLVPFPVLRSGVEGREYLCERFSILAVPSLSALRPPRSTRPKSTENTVSALVIGNPRLPMSVTEHYGWSDIPHAQHEATMVAELLQAKALLGPQATKDAVLAQIADAECVHLACHVSWKLSAIVLSPSEVLDSQTPSKRYYTTGADSLEAEDESCELSSNAELPPVSEFLLSAADILNLKLSARLVVVSSSHTRDQQGWATSDGLAGLTRALMAAGAQAVLVVLWPVPDTATKILLRAFYSALLQGARVARALSEAMQTVQHTKHFAHPANWAGFLLLGANIRLSNKVALMGQALCELLKAPDKCRDALRVTLHLVEKSLQRIHRGQKNAMYTTQKSIENKVGQVGGWKELLMSVGFRFEPAANGIPSSVFFPQSDPEERLTQCSASLQALLGLSSTSLQALSKLMSNVDVADDIIGVFRAIMSQFHLKSNSDDNDSSIEVPLSVRLWRVAGCHELLASLGFDLMDVGQDEVTLRTSKMANRRNIQFVLQALLALFDTQEAPKSLSLDSSSSLESLASIDNDCSHSDNELTPSTTSRSSVLLRNPQQTSLVKKQEVDIPTPSHPPLSLGRAGAFTSYVRRRGEPDGRTEPRNNLTKPPATIVTRPGGGGESDAAFTPSPPVSLSLAHQTRIRSLYSMSGQEHKVLRPDSSSSASSATDWESSGHATVLRRQPLPPLPPPRTQQLTNSGPLVDNMLPLTQVYNNLTLDGHSSDSDFEKVHSKTVIQSRRFKPPSASSGTNSLFKATSKKAHIDKLSCCNDISDTSTTSKSLTLPSNDDTVSGNERLLYFSPTDSSTLPVVKGVLPKVSSDNDGKSSESKISNSNAMQDSIMTTQLRNMTRELTPTISEVYHERNIGLGLAPPLAKLLLNQNTTNSTGNDNSVLDKLKLNNLSLVDCETEPTKESNNKPWLPGANTSAPSVQNADLTTADILVREAKRNELAAQAAATALDNSKRSVSPFSEMSRRDEGDGRSIADSQCSSSYKVASIQRNRHQIPPVPSHRTRNHRP